MALGLTDAGMAIAGDLGDGSSINWRRGFVRMPEVAGRWN